MNVRSRRRFLKSALAGAGAAVFLPRLACGGEGHAASQKTPAPRPTAAQKVWQDCDVGLLYSFDLPVAAGVFKPNNTSRKTFDPKLYNPRKLDTDQWIEAAKAAGARYAVFTATHFNGFLQWQSDAYAYGVRQSPWRGGRGDVVADFVASCRKAGIRPGIYFSTHRNVYQGVWSHWVDWGRGKGTAKQDAFNRIAQKMTEELCSRYGPLVQIWFDAGVKAPFEGGPDVLPIFEKHQPDSVFYHSKQRSDHRWIGNEAGRAGYPCWATMPYEKDNLSHNSAKWRGILGRGDPDGKAWSPGMVDVPLRGSSGVHNWFWKPGQDRAVHSVETLMRMYYNSVGRNCNLVIGEVISSEGLVPACDIRRLGEFGKEVRRRFGKPVARTSGEGAERTLQLPAPCRVDHVIIMEDLEHGERIRRYTVDGLLSDGSRKVLCEGISVGHKRIERFDPVELVSLKLRVTRSTSRPILRELAVYAATS